MQKELKTNIVINLIRTITMTVLSFVTFPIVCRLLGDSMLGSFSWATSFVYYFIVLSKISIPNIAIRECAKVKEDPIKLSKKVQEFFILQAIMTVLSFGLMCLIVFTIPSFQDTINQTLIFILSLNFLTSVFAFEWVFTALEKHTYLSIRSIVILAIVDILIFAFIKRPDDVYLYTFITTLTTILTVVSNLIILPRYVKFKTSGPYNLKQYIPMLGIMFFISLLLAIYNKTDSFILGLIDKSKESVGSYSVGMKGVDIVIGIFTALSSVFMPRASALVAKNDEGNYRKLNEHSSNLVFFVTVPAIALMSTLSYPITSLISGSFDGKSYTEASSVLIALCSLMLTYSLANMIYTQILIPKNKEKIYLYAMLIGSIVNIGLSLLAGIYIFDNTPAFGIALMTSITDVLILIFLVVFTFKDSRRMIFNFNNLKIIIISVIIGVVAYFIGPILLEALNNSMDITYAAILEILIILAGAIMFYFVSLLLLKENIICSTLNIKRKAEK